MPPRVLASWPKPQRGQQLEFRESLLLFFYHRRFGKTG